MQWKRAVEPKLPLGVERMRFGFLWLPKTIDLETRWLERACWTERYVVETLTVGLTLGVNVWQPMPLPKVWRAVRWNRLRNGVGDLI